MPVLELSINETAQHIIFLCKAFVTQLRTHPFLHLLVVNLFFLLLLFHLYEYIIVCLSILLMMDILVVSQFLAIINKVSMNMLV